MSDTIPQSFDALYLLEVQYPHRVGRGRWWAGDQRGYTDDLLLAGTFTRAAAQERAARSDRSVAVPLLDVLVQILDGGSCAITPSGVLCRQLPGTVGAALNFDVKSAFVEHVRRYTAQPDPKS